MKNLYNIEHEKYIFNINNWKTFKDKAARFKNIIEKEKKR